MLNFPLPYSEELLYSTIARAGVRYGLVSPKQLLDEVFESRGVSATLDLPNHLATISRCLLDDFSTERLIYEHTLFPIYAPFVPEERRQRCMKWMFGESQGSVHLALGVAASRIKIPRVLRYCPGCLATQRLRQGEYFWVREWQVAGIETCPEHGDLIDTRLARPAVERHRFIAATPEYCPLVRQRTGDPMSTWVGCQVRQLLERPSQLSPSFAQWTRYYQNLARQNGLCRGDNQIDHQALRERTMLTSPFAWLARCHLTSRALDDNESDWLRAIFRKHRKSFSYLQHIVVHQALLGKFWQICEVLEEVCRCPAEDRQPQKRAGVTVNRGLVPDQEDWLRLLSSHPPKQVRKISPALYARLYRNHRDWLLEVNRSHAGDRSGHSRHRVDWNKRDREYLHALRQWAIFMDASSLGPRRSRSYYLKINGSPSTIEKNLHRMPLSTAFMSAHIESVAQYQIRRLQNAHDELRNRFDSPPRWRLLRKAKLSEERLTELAKTYLEQRVYKQYEI